ncbi:MAG TPA: DUF1080 domain-containing protein [Humisphaera sp.]
MISRLRIAALAGLAAFAFAPVAHAADGAKPAAAAPAEQAKVEEGFTSLFNGKDLTGWIYGKTKGKDGKEGENKAGKGYQVKDGGIVYCTKGDGGNLYTEKEYSNFVLRFEFKLSESANNGIGIRAPLIGDSAYVGMEIQVLDNGGKMYKKPDGTPSIRPAQYHGSVYGVFPAKDGFQKPVGEWNTEEIMADGDHIKVTLNGTVILDCDLSTVTDEKVLKAHPGLKNKAGHIGFLGHGADVEFRNLRIKELPAAPAK